MVSYPEVGFSNDVTPQL
ncbi:hypothetical protein EYF80_062903 [Liparis tanakae]|uniref:Uncharacterized protein n=1 Tax=Liparis tanakae TaxID=230148 RepID=A0A4Z2EDW5_9TELE|nr:hypothetical protein EYF80_062903 [Liparis tanakae]